MTKKTAANTTSTSHIARSTRPQEPAKTTDNNGDGRDETLGGGAPAPGAMTSIATVSQTPATAAKEGTTVAVAADEKKSAGVQIVTRLPVELGARLDRFTESLRNERLGLRVTRADAVRILVHEALAAHEARREAVPASPRG